MKAGKKRQKKAKKEQVLRKKVKKSGKIGKKAKKCLKKCTGFLSSDIGVKIGKFELAALGASDWLTC